MRSGASNGIMRHTRQRAAILHAVECATDHPTAAEIFQRVHSQLPGIGYATVYRNLRALADAGLIREIRGREATLYDRGSNQHGHLICVRCGAVADIDVPLAAEALATVSAETGYRVTSQQAELFGVCPACQREA